MPALPVRCQVLPGRVVGRCLCAWALLLALMCGVFLAAPAQAQGVELALLKTSRAEGSLNLDF